MRIIDKYNLHPFGGYCTCYSAPYITCRVCKATKEYGARWAKLTPEETAQAEREIEELYPRTSNQDGR